MSKKMAKNLIYTQDLRLWDERIQKIVKNLSLKQENRKDKEN